MKNISQKKLMALAALIGAFAGPKAQEAIVAVLGVFL